MKKLIFILAIAVGIVGQNIVIPLNHVNTYEDLLNYPYFAEGKSVVCADPVRGGNFQLTADGFGFDGVVKIALNTPNQYAKRVGFNGVVNIRWGNSIHETLHAVSNCVVSVPPGDYPIVTPLQPNSGTHITGKGARFYNAATNVAGLVIFDIVEKRDIIIEDITLDSGIGSQYITGNLWMRGCTNVIVRGITSDNGGYLGNYVVVSHGTNSLGEEILSEDCIAVNCIFGDQIFGGSGESLAGVSIAESSRRCHIIDCKIVYDTVGKLGIVYEPTPSSQHPQAPVLMCSIDRGFECDVRGLSITNPSGMTNLAGLTFEDNRGDTNIFNSIEDVSIQDVHIGVQLALYHGRFRASRLLVRNCTRFAFKTYQTEPADVHNVVDIQLDQPIFINNHANTDFHTDENGHVISDVGQVAWGAKLPYKMTINQGQFITYSADPKFAHIRHDSGELFLNNCTFVNGTWAVRVPDPVDPDIITVNNLYEAYGKNRRLLAIGCRYINVTKPVYGEADPFADLNFLDNQMNGSIRAYFFKELQPNTLSDLFTITTVKSTQGAIKRSGGYGAKMRFFVSNGGTNDFAVGQMFGQYIEGGWSHAVMENDVNSFATNSLFAPSLVTPMAQTAERGYTNIIVFATNTVWHTATMKFRADTITPEVTNVFVYGVVDILPGGFWQSPIIDTF